MIVKGRVRGSKAWDWWIFCVFTSILFANYLMCLDDYPMFCLGLDDASRFFLGVCNESQVAGHGCANSLWIPSDDGFQVMYHHDMICRGSYLV